MFNHPDEPNEIGMRSEIADWVYDEKTTPSQIQHVYYIIKEIDNPQEDIIKSQEDKKDGI